MALTNNDYNALPQLANIQGFWRMEEESGNRADLSDNANTLQDNATVLFGAGKIGNAADFELDNDEYLSITNALQTGLGITGSISMFMWIKPESITGEHILFSKWLWDGAQRSYRFSILANGSLQVDLSDNGTNSDKTASDAADVVTGSFQHVGFTWNSTSKVVTIYVDGLSVGTPGSFDGPIADKTGNFEIGHQEAIGLYFDGLGDEAIVWNTCLTAEEVLAVKNITTVDDYKLPTATGGFFIFLSEAYDKGKEHFKNKLWLPNNEILVPEGI